MTVDQIPNRRHDRVSVALRMVLESEIDADSSDTYMSNLGLGGCFIRSSQPLRTGLRIQLKFQIEGHPEPIAAVGVVRWVRDSSDGSGGMGIQFEEIRPQDLVLLKQFIEKQLVSDLFS